MNLKEITFILVRILSMYTIIKGLGHLIDIVQIMIPFYIDTGSSFNVFAIILISSFTGIFFLAIGILTWIKAGWMASLINRDDEMKPSEVALAKNTEWYTLGLTLVGTVLFVETLPNLISFVGQLIQYSTTEDHIGFNDQRNKIWLQIGVTTLKLIMAIVLVLRASGLSVVLRKIRDLGNGHNEAQNH